ncbi:hypothetical protein GJ496_010655 [Pomphorhynchus laevis]|nr:hypothetical protein GJ496_010655 [Pomphorhynchus laevis]
MHSSYLYLPSGRRMSLASRSDHLSVQLPSWNNNPSNVRMFNLNQSRPISVSPQYMQTILNSQDSGYSSQQTIPPPAPPVSQSTSLTNSLKDEILTEVHIRTDALRATLIQHIDNQIENIVETVDRKIKEECENLGNIVKNGARKTKEQLKKSRNSATNMQKNLEKNVTLIKREITKIVNKGFIKYSQLVQKQHDNSMKLLHYHNISKKKARKNVIRRLPLFVSQSISSSSDCESTHLDFTLLRKRLLANNHK